MLSVMKKVLYGSIGLVALLVLVFRTSSSVPSVRGDLLEDAAPSSSAEQTTSTSSMSSSLNLIVRVSPSLGKKKPVAIEDQRSYLSPEPEGSLYRSYSSDVVLEGRNMLLFFVQTGDPFTEEHDGILSDAAKTRQLQVLTYRIDFGENSTLRFRYGVIVPDTFVLIDAKGNKLQSILHPSESELRALLSTPA